jgi:hypothetical protein
MLTEASGNHDQFDQRKPHAQSLRELAKGFAVGYWLQDLR